MKGTIILIICIILANLIMRKVEPKYFKSYLVYTILILAIYLIAYFNLLIK